MNPTLRTLPIRVAPLPGEGLDSWLEATAARLDAPLGLLTNQLGLDRYRPGQANRLAPDWTIGLHPREAQQLSAATDVAPDVLHAMTLARWHGRAVEVDRARRAVRPQTLWGRGSGSRYCPRCLAESAGRWQLAWRLGWSFACVRHQVLLADFCPGCRRIPRATAVHPVGVIPIQGCCPRRPRTGPRGHRTLCGQPLAQSVTSQLPPDSPLLAAQQTLNDLIDDTNDTDGAMLFGAYGATAVSARQILADLKILATRVMLAATDDDLAAWADPRTLDQYRRYMAERPTTVGRGVRVRASDRTSFAAPLDAAATGVSLTAALHVLSAPTLRTAGERISWLTERTAQRGAALYPASVRQWGAEVSDTVVAIFHSSRDPHLRPIDRLRYRTTLGTTARTSDVDARLAAVPSMLWHSWALRLSPRHGGGALRLRRQLMSVALLLAGNSLSIGRACALLGGNITNRHLVSDLLAEAKARPECASVIPALALLATSLDQQGPPIDYARRRAVFGKLDQFIDPQRWEAAQRGLRSNPSARSTHAQRWLFETLTASPIETASRALAPETDGQRAYYRRFLWRILPTEAELLHQVAADLLARHRIDEPVQWEPTFDPQAMAHLTLPGIDPDSIPPQRAHDAAGTGDAQIAEIARRLDTTTDHATYLLSTYPVDWSPPRYRLTQHAAASQEQWRAWYQDDGLSLEAIAKLAGRSPAAIKIGLRKQKVALRPACGRPRYMDRADEVADRYTRRGQTVSQIARDTGISATTIRQMLKRGGTPSGQREPQPSSLD